MRHGLIVLLVAACVAALPGAERPAIADQVANAAGCQAWPSLKRVKFTWRYVAKDLARSYDWDLAKRSVVVDIGNASATVPQDGPGKDDSDPAAPDAHKAFVNDSYWAFFCLHLHWDDSTITDLGEVDVPQFPDLGKHRALSVQYPANGAGYTPGDKYVLYLGADFLPVAWAFHKGGAEAPTLVVKWLDWTTVKGLHVPTRFVKPDGSDFIRIESLSAE
jgi:hypothetical protein